MFDSYRVRGASNPKLARFRTMRREKGLPSKRVHIPPFEGEKSDAHRD